MINVVGNSGKVLDTFRNDVWISVNPIAHTIEVLGFTAYSIVAIVTLFMINVKVTLFIFIPLSIVLFLLNKVTGKIQGYRKHNREVAEKISENISDITDSVLTIKVTGSYDSVVEHYDQLNRKRFKVTINDVIFNSTIRGFANSTIFIGTAVMMLATAKLMLSGKFLAGDFSVFIYYLGTLASLIEHIVELVATYKQGEVSYKRIADLVGKENCSDLTKKSPIYLKKNFPDYLYEECTREKLHQFEVKGLSYYFDDGTTGIKDISFSLNSGEILAVSGMIGSGKSTLLSVLLGVIKESEGKIYWNNNEIKQRSEFMKPANVAYIAQKSNLYNGTIRENICLRKRFLTMRLWRL